MQGHQSHRGDGGGRRPYADEDADEWTNQYADFTAYLDGDTWRIGYADGYIFLKSESVGDTWHIAHDRSDRFTVSYAADGTIVYTWADANAHRGPSGDQHADLVAHEDPNTSDPPKWRWRAEQQPYADEDIDTEPDGSADAEPDPDPGAADRYHIDTYPGSYYVTPGPDGFAIHWDDGHVTRYRSDYTRIDSPGNGGVS